MVVVILAHPFLDRSTANRALLLGLDGLKGVEIRSLYDLYPDFAIDVVAEREVLGAASAVVWQHPIYWYTVPALLKLWFERVLIAGWAWGRGGTALRGKPCQWVATTGGAPPDYSPTGIHGQGFEAFVPVVRQTAEFCGMTWLDPLIVHDAGSLDGETLAGWGREYRTRLAGLGAGEEVGDG